MSEPRSVVITGASRGLGLASATHLYSNGWRVVAAMRAPEVGMTRLRQATGATDDDPRLIGVQLDLTDSASVTAAAKMIAEAVGAPYALVHNAGISAAGMAEETPIGLWEKMFHTTIFGPGMLTNALLPAMRDAGRGRIVMVSSVGGVRGMPARSRRSALASRSWSPAPTTPTSSPAPAQPTAETSTDHTHASTPRWISG